VNGSWGWATHRKTEDTGLTFMRARWYAPGVGRFVSPDSVVPRPSEPQAFNRYSYSFNSPLKFTDPNGHSPIDAVRYIDQIVAAGNKTGLPALTVAAAISSQTNGMWYDFAAAKFGTNQTLGPGQVNTTQASSRLGRSVTQDELMSNPVTSIDVRAQIVAEADRSFLSVCGTACNAQSMEQDRWLVMALSQNDQTPNIGAAWDPTSGSFNWDSQLSETDSKAGSAGIRDKAAYLTEQGFRSRDRFLIGQFADSLEYFAQAEKAIRERTRGNQGLISIPKNIDNTIKFLRCMSQTGATTGGCR